MQPTVRNHGKMVQSRLVSLDEKRHDEVIQIKFLTFLFPFKKWTDKYPAQKLSGVNESLFVLWE
jgi:hypothetical protein